MSPNAAQAQVFEQLNVVKVMTGSTALDQFQCDYLMRAFCFLYAYHIGGPDFDRSPSRRVEKHELAPLQLAAYSRIMARRCEHQFRADWQFLGGLWNLLFKSLVNRAPSLSFRYSAPGGAPGDADEQSVGAAAESLYKKL